MTESTVQFSYAEGKIRGVLQTLATAGSLRERLEVGAGQLLHLRFDESNLPETCRAIFREIDAALTRRPAHGSVSAAVASVRAMSESELEELETRILELWIRFRETFSIGSRWNNPHSTNEEDGDGGIVPIIGLFG